MRLQVTFLGAFALLVVMPSSAPARTAVTPKPGQYWGPSVLPGGQVVPAGELGLSFRVSAGGSSIAAHAAIPAGRCGRPFTLNTIPIRNGSFTFTGKAQAVLLGTGGKSTPGSITWTGKWSSATSVSGTAQFKTATCDSGLIHWKAKLGGS
jgi:hypothetical protein